MADDKKKNKDPKQEAINAYKSSVKQAESGGSSKAKASTSSATGLYQFTEDTWKEMEKKLGKKLDIFNEKDQELAMNKLTEINVRALEKNGIAVTPSNLYMVHFLGVSGGPKFLKNLEKNPNELASKYVSKGALAANESLFFNNDKPVSAAELYNKMSSKVGGAEQPTATPPMRPSYRELPQGIDIESTRTFEPTLNRDIKPGKKTVPKQVSDASLNRVNPINDNNANLGLSQSIDFLPKDINLTLSEDEQLEDDLDNVNIAEYGGTQSSDKSKENSTLIEFNEGGKHEENKYGGIPQGVGPNGKLNTVEEGETKFNNYVFSDTLIINDGDVESLYLPKEVAGKTFADASKFIHSILDGNPNDRIIKKTVEKQLDSLTLGNEKARLAKEELDVNLGNFSGDNNQMFLGGFGGQNSTMSANTQQLMQGAGAMGAAMPSNMNVSGTPLSDKDMQNREMWEGTKDSVASAIPIAGLFRGLEKAGKGLGQSLGGDEGGDFATGFLDPMSTIMSEDTNFGEKTLAVLDPVASGIIMKNKNKAKRAEAGKKNAYMLNNKYTSDFSYGGDLNGGDDPKYIPTAEDGFNLQPFSFLDPYDEELMQSNSMGDDSNVISISDEELNNPGFETESDFERKEAYRAKGKNYLQYAPVLGDFLNLRDAMKDKAEVERLNKIGKRFTPDYVDETYLQNIVSNDYDNNINALTNASGGSAGGLRASILGANSTRARALSNAYFKMDESNRNQHLQGQQFDLNIDQFNIGQDNTERDINARNRAAIEDRKRASRDTMFRDLGAIGREQTYDNRLYNLTGGYDSMGGYNPDRISVLEELGLMDDNKKKNGGLLSNAAKDINNTEYNKLKEEFNKKYR